MPEGFWLRAEQQTGGRGRLGRDWVSPEGNLYCSTIVCISKSDPPPHTLSFAAALAVYATLESSLPKSAEIKLKWPNDVLVSNAKIAGILLERTGNTIIVGIGLNVGFSPDVPRRDIISIAEIDSGKKHDCADVLHHLAHNFASILASWREHGIASIIEEWQRHAHHAGEPLSVTGSDGKIRYGTYAGLAPDGALQLHLSDGTLIPIYAGDVTRL